MLPKSKRFLLNFEHNDTDISFIHTPAFTSFFFFHISLSFLNIENGRSIVTFLLLFVSRILYQYARNSTITGTPKARYIDDAVKFEYASTLGCLSISLHRLYVSNSEILFEHDMVPVKSLFTWINFLQLFEHSGSWFIREQFLQGLSVIYPPLRSNFFSLFNLADIICFLFLDLSKKGGFNIFSYNWITDQTSHAAAWTNNFIYYIVMSVLIWYNTR